MQKTNNTNKCYGVLRLNYKPQRGVIFVENE